MNNAFSLILPPTYDEKDNKGECGNGRHIVPYIYRFHLILYISDRSQNYIHVIQPRLKATLGTTYDGVFVDGMRHRQIVGGNLRCSWFNTGNPDVCVVL